MNYYQILKIPENASYDDIKKAYRKLARKYHPDKNNGRTQDIFKKITVAYQTLVDPYERGKYDQALNTDFAGHFPNNFSNDFFGSNIFGPMGVFDKVFNQPFFKKQPNNNSYTKSYSSKIIQTKDRNGKIKTKKKISVTNNGKKKRSLSRILY